MTPPAEERLRFFLMLCSFNQSYVRAATLVLVPAMKQVAANDEAHG